MTQFTIVPIFDTDQHVCETPESLMKCLPEKPSHTVQFTQIGKQIHIVINNKEPKVYWKYAEGMDERRTYDFIGDNARRFLGLPIANPHPAVTNPRVGLRLTQRLP